MEGFAPHCEALADDVRRAAAKRLYEPLRPVEHENTTAFAFMAVPNQEPDRFLRENRHLPEASRELKPDDSQYHSFYLSTSTLNFGDEQSPALLF